MSGTPRRVTGSSVSRVAQRTGSTAFLLADGVMRPFKGRPPRTIRLLTSAPRKIVGAPLTLFPNLRARGVSRSNTADLMGQILIKRAPHSGPANATPRTAEAFRGRGTDQGDK